MRSFNKYLPFCLGVLILAWIRSRTTPVAQPLFIEAVEGDTLCAPGGSPWAQANQKALIIVTSPLCSACRVNNDFTDEIDSYASSHGLVVHYVIGQRAELNEGAEALRKSGKRVHRVSLGEFGVLIEPTYFRVDSSGRIESRWGGTVLSEERADVLFSLVSGAGRNRYTRLSVAEATEYIRMSDPQLVGLSPKGAMRAGLVIGLKELETRCRYELDRDKPVVLDCTSARAFRECQRAAITLKMLQFRDVIAAGMPARPVACK